MNEYCVLQLDTERQGKGETTALRVTSTSYSICLISREPCLWAQFGLNGQWWTACFPSPAKSQRWLVVWVISTMTQHRDPGEYGPTSGKKQEGQNSTWCGVSRQGTHSTFLRWRNVHCLPREIKRKLKILWGQQLRKNIYKGSEKEWWVKRPDSSLNSREAMHSKQGQKCLWPIKHWQCVPCRS